MADLAHSASGAASSEPVGITQQAKQPASSDSGKLRVFISYSRDDLKFADQLDAALNTYGFECLIDRHDISGGEDWKRRLGNLISEADTIVFVLSPSSAGSPICTWEVEEATRLNKRILPVNCRPLEGASPPPGLRERNYIFFYEEPKLLGSGFGIGLANLITALNTDFDWLREHTRYLQRAIEWDTGGRPANRLLSGNDILEAKAWAARRPKSAPELTALQLDFIRASEEEAEARLSEQRKQLDAMAAAQAEREKALHEAEEALKQAADAQRRRARIRNIALVVVSILAVVAVLFGVGIVGLKYQADEMLARAQNIIAKSDISQMDNDTKKEVFAVFRTGADKGNPPAMRNLGMAYRFGYGVAQDYAQAREWFEKAADNGYAGAMTDLGLLYEAGQGVTQEHAKAREWYEKAADKGDEDAMNRLGLLYENGYGVAQDYAKAREWYERAAAKDNVDGMLNLGVLYGNGHGVTRDYAKARELYEKAAAKDSAIAMYDLGVLYGNGYGVTRDYAKAGELYEKAADKGEANAMSGLGALYATGRGVKRDYYKAREWFERAAAKDNVDGMLNLGVLYERGDGVKRDYDKAREWYEKAAAQGQESAKMALERLSIREAATGGRYAEALQRQEALAAKVEAEETKRDEKLGEQTAEDLRLVSEYALSAKEFAKALTVADRAHTLFPDNVEIETNRAHALMFLGHDEEAKALYLAHKGEPVARSGGELWEQAIAEDFAEFRKAGLTPPMMDDIEKELGISR
jgi:TPR repeat protein